MSDDSYNLFAATANTLQAVNFSVNFILYYIINVHFRRAVSRLLRCRRLHVGSSGRHTRASEAQNGVFRGSSVTMHATESIGDDVIRIDTLTSLRRGGRADAQRQASSFM